VVVRTRLRDGLKLLRHLLGFDGRRWRFGAGVGLILRRLCNRNRLDLMHASGTVVSNSSFYDHPMCESIFATEEVGVWATHRSWAASLRLAPAAHSLQHPPSLGHLANHPGNYCRTRRRSGVESLGV
jgi:hypothetical protein